MKFLNFNRFINLMICKNQFKKHSMCDMKKNKFIYTARCENSGEKDNIKVGNHCTISAYFVSRFGGKIVIGDNNYFGKNTFLLCKESIVIGNDVIISDNVIICDNNNHPTSPKQRLMMTQVENFMTNDLWSWKYASSAPILIEDNVWIGRDVRIMKGVKIGKGSIIALGAVVTKDVPEYSIAAGNPAVVVKKLERE